MEEYFMELGKNLEEERESYHFTQKEVADILHVSRANCFKLGTRCQLSGFGKSGIFK